MTVHYQRHSVHTSDDIRAIADHAGSYFFSAAAMSAFKSRLLTGVYCADGTLAQPGSRFFIVTSERYEAPYEAPEPRHYKVRRVILGTVRDERPAVDIMSVGEQFATAHQARKFAELLAAVIIVHRDYSQSFDGDYAEAIEHVRNTLILPHDQWVPGSFRIENDDTLLYHSYKAVLRASADTITAALSAIAE